MTVLWAERLYSNEFPTDSMTQRLIPILIVSLYLGWGVSGRPKQLLHMYIR
jgi:hypothetical protein